MSLEGSILDGAIVLDDRADLPDGTRVRIEPVPAPSPVSVGTPGRKPIASLQALKETLERERENPPPPGPTLAERLKDFIGAVDDLPEDASVNVDHYLYGHPKK